LRGEGKGKVLVSLKKAGKKGRDKYRPAFRGGRKEADRKSFEFRRGP